MSNKSPTGRTVFIANEGYHDYTEAGRWGDLVPVTRKRVDIEHTDRLQGRIHDVLQNAEKDDYLLISGSPVISVLCAGYLFRRFGHVNVIYWDPLMGGYHTRTLTFEHKE